MALDQLLKISQLTTTDFICDPATGNLKLGWSLQDNGDGTFEVIDNNGVRQGALVDANSVVTNTIVGNTIATHTSAGGTIVDINETITSLGYAVDPVSNEGVLTYLAEDGTSTVINLPRENFLASANYDDTLDVLSLTLVDGTVVNVAMADLLIDGNDIQAVGDSCVTLTKSGTGTPADPVIITASVNVSAAANNLLSCEADGLFADASIGQLTNVSPSSDTQVVTPTDCFLLGWDGTEWAPVNLAGAASCANLGTH